MKNLSFWPYNGPCLQFSKMFLFSTITSWQYFIELVSICKLVGPLNLATTFLGDPGQVFHGQNLQPGKSYIGITISSITSKEQAPPISNVFYPLLFRTCVLEDKISCVEANESTCLHQGEYVMYIGNFPHVSNKCFTLCFDFIQ